MNSILCMIIIIVVVVIIIIILLSLLLLLLVIIIFDVQVETERTYSCQERGNGSFAQLCRQQCVRQSIFQKCGCVDPWLLSKHVEEDVWESRHLLCDSHNSEQRKYSVYVRASVFVLCVCMWVREREREREREGEVSFR